MTFAHPRLAPALAGLALAWLAPIAVLGVRGDFPLNDDWAFAQSAQQLATTGAWTRVQAAGVAPERIAGGFEFGGRCRYARTDRFVVGDEYLLTLQPSAPGYAPYAQAELARWLPPSAARVYVLRRR